METAMEDLINPFCYRTARAVRSFFKKLGPIEYLTLVLATSAAAQAYYFLQSERSFLALSGMEVSGLTTMSDQPLEFSLEIKNGGRSTAFIDYMNATAQIRPDELPDFPLYGYRGSTSVRGPVLAGSTYFATFNPKNDDGTPFVLSDSQISAIHIGTMKLYIFGYIRYRDEFSLFGDKETGYCSLFNPRGNQRTMFVECGKEHYVYAK
jgi:hypothetical protein